MATRRLSSTSSVVSAGRMAEKLVEGKVWLAVPHCMMGREGGMQNISR